MKCPLNRGRYPFEGGDDCVLDCAAAVDVGSAKVCPANAAAVSLMVMAGLVRKEEVRVSVQREVRE